MAKIRVNSPRLYLRTPEQHLDNAVWRKYPKWKKKLVFCPGNAIFVIRALMFAVVYIDMWGSSCHDTQIWYILFHLLLYLLFICVGVSWSCWKNFIQALVGPRARRGEEDDGVALGPGYIGKAGKKGPHGERGPPGPRGRPGNAFPGNTSNFLEDIGKKRLLIHFLSLITTRYVCNVPGILSASCVKLWRGQSIS